MIIFLRNIIFSVLITIEIRVLSDNIFYSNNDSFTNKYGYFSEDERYTLLEEAKSMFYFGYDSYMRYAFPMDELNPINCCGRGPDYGDRLNININDILGDYSLTLVDSLDSLAILGNSTEFQRAVGLVTKFVNFDKDNVVQVFEVNIRIIGALLSAHLIMVDPVQPFGAMKPTWYQDELLHMARDLAVRLLPAFQNSTTGIPYPRVNLRHGNVEGLFSSETCPAGAGTFVLEMGILSRLLGDNRFENFARRAIDSLWNTRNKETGLLGNVINAKTGEWVGKLSGLGAGLDSFYEYLIKSYIMFGNIEDYLMFQRSYQSIKKYMRVGRNKCNSGDGDHPIFVNVNMNTGNVFTPWIDSLQASFAGIQVLDGDIEEAICLHALYYFMWKKYGVLPERWNWKLLSADVMFYPLRPELAESTYLLYQATKSPFYLHVGKDILENLNQFTKTTCGYATVHNVDDMSLEDRMESFFLSETTKYLYLLFDTDHYLNKNFEKYIFNTEGHLLPILSQFRSTGSILSPTTVEDFTDDFSNATIAAQLSCSAVTSRRQWLPLENKYLLQIKKQFNIKDI